MRLQALQIFVSGLIPLADWPVRVGDVVVIRGEVGRVQRISVRSMLIGAVRQASVVIRNSDLIAWLVRNRSPADGSRESRLPPPDPGPPDRAGVRREGLRFARIPFATSGRVPAAADAKQAPMVVAG